MLMAGSPQVAPDASLVQQDCLLLNRLPFADDLRQLQFKDFTQYKADPNKQHVSVGYSSCTHCNMSACQFLASARAAAATRS
jgi:hypothetical protein